MSQRSLPLLALALAVLFATAPTASGLETIVKTRARPSDADAFGVGALSVALPRNVSRGVSLVERVVVPGVVAVRAPGIDRTFRAYVMARNGTNVRWEKRRVRQFSRARVDDAIDRMFARSRVADENEERNWRVVDTVSGAGAGSWVVFDACDDTWLDDDDDGANARNRFEYRIRFADDASIDDANATAFAYVAVDDGSTGGASSRRCERSRRRREDR